VNKEPALIIGTIVTIILGVVQTLDGNGFISDALAGHITDATNALSQIILLLLPLITAALIRSQVTPANKA
jgi:hypothetical protein